MSVSLTEKVPTKPKPSAPRWSAAQRAVRTPGATPVASTPTATKSERVVRWVNLALALIAIACLAPLMAIIALLVRFTSPGPVLYTQTRVGIDRRGGPAGQTLGTRRRANDLGGSPFRIYKFRTMRVNAEAETGEVWASTNDPRVTPIGKVLRRTRLDELPQLFNVVLGDMNIVGPRPERPTIFADLRQKITNYEWRQRAKPGITGLAQISQQYDASLDDVRQKVVYDLEYLKHRTLRSDFEIMWKTIPVMLFRRGGW